MADKKRKAETDVGDAIRTELRAIYGREPPELVSAIAELIDSCTRDVPPRDESTDLWDEKDVVLITYADSVRDGDRQSPLLALLQFITDHKLQEVLSCVHFLPFFPFTSDDGFSVVDYRQVDPEVGTWDDIEQYHRRGFRSLMYDLVLNHCSQASEYFQGFLRGDPRYADFFIDQTPCDELRSVVRPRALPLLSPYKSADGRELNVWTTFSADQVDLNYANPKVLAEMISVLVEFARRGARIVRLDAIAYLWKEVGTSCIHLPQTHAAVRLMRLVMERCYPATLLLTETNVPHIENISYFGKGDEAHMVYNFSLPPLLLDAVHSGNCDVLRTWLGSLPDDLPSRSTTFFNFTASHDGIGVRPLEGIVPRERIMRLAEIVRSHGGRVNMRTLGDGTESPYELNITYVDAVADRSKVPAAEHARAFLATQKVQLSICGMPAVYVHSLLGTANDIEGMETSGINRRINRHKYERAELDEKLAGAGTVQRLIFDGYCALLRHRRSVLAFHPNAAQEVLEWEHMPDGVLAFARTASDDGQRVAVVVNFGEQSATVPLRHLFTEENVKKVREVCGEPVQVTADGSITVRRHDVFWLVREASE